MPDAAHADASHEVENDIAVQVMQADTLTVRETHPSPLRHTLQARSDQFAFALVPGQGGRPGMG
jgi:hypothetical protein